MAPTKKRYLVITSNIPRPDTTRERQREVIIAAVGKISELIIERGGHELGVDSLHRLERFLTKLARDFAKAGKPPPRH
jgi:hypothetical protein